MSEVVTPLTAVNHLPPLLKCRDCRHSAALLMENGRVRVYCTFLHVQTFSNLNKKPNLILDCSQHQPRPPTPVRLVPKVEAPQQPVGGG